MKIFRTLLIFMIFSGFYVISGSTVKVPEIKTEIIYINGNQNFKIVKPVFTDSVKFKTINSEINKIINIEEFQKEEKEFCINDPEKCRDYEVIIEPHIIYADNNVISFTISGYQYTGGAHGGSWVDSFLVDRKTGKLITDSLKVNNKIVFNKIQKYINDNPLGIFFSERYTAKELMDSAVAYQTGKDTVGIMYLSYSVAPYAAGMPEFEYNIKTKKLYFFDNYSGGDTKKTEIK